MTFTMFTEHQTCFKSLKVLFKIPQNPNLQCESSHLRNSSPFFLSYPNRYPRKNQRKPWQSMADPWQPRRSGNTALERQPGNLVFVGPSRKIGQNVGF